MSTFGIIGLAVMGANLARNAASRKIKTLVYNRTTSKMEDLISEYGNEYLEGEAELKDFVAKLERPRKIMLMVQAGKAVDLVLEQLIPLLDPEDIVIDGGNSNFNDTIGRFEALTEKGIRFVGCGVSGGEEGALNGPSLMPGGNFESWKSLKPIFESIAAKDFNGGPCVAYIGDNGAGHYIKMVHNGIEYGVMQMMAEGYDILRKVYKMSALEISQIFGKFNQGKLNSFLFEISEKVLSKKDDLKEGYLIDSILDKAAQKGTGKWTAIDSLDRGITLSSITESVYARTLSAAKEKREQISKLYSNIDFEQKIDLDQFIPILEDALYAGMLSSYAQGYDLIQTAAKEQKWDIDLSEISRIWEGGCIIRAKILNFLHEAYLNQENKNMHLFAIPEIKKSIQESIPNLRKLVAMAAETGVSIPSLATGLMYFDGMTNAQSSANFIQGLRDYFGAHTYERNDEEGSFHAEW